MSNNFIEAIAAGLAKHKLVPFFGAGTSARHLNVLWEDVSEEMANAANVAVDKRDDFLKVADEFIAFKGNREGQRALAELLRKRLISDHFDDVKGWPHLFLLSLNAGVYYTTNQDNLFELASKKIGHPYRVVARLEDLAESVPSDGLLIKYHGDLAYPETVLFTGASYKSRIDDYNHFLNIRMRADLLAKGFLFIGYSFRDPNVQFLFRELRAAFGAGLPPSHLIAYRYDSSMDELHREFGVNIIDPCSVIPDARDHDEAFVRYLKLLSERVLVLKAEAEVASWIFPAVPPSIRVATEFDVAAVAAAAKTKAFLEGLRTYRALLDETEIPAGLEEQVLKAFRILCDGAQTNADLAALAAAVFNFSLPPVQALNAISGLMVAINRLDIARGYPEFMILSPRHGDQIISMAAALAVAEIKQNGGMVKEAFRCHALSGWMVGYDKAPPEIQENVRAMMEVAWRDSGQSAPYHLFERNGPFTPKTFSEIYEELKSRLPQKLARPSN